MKWPSGVVLIYVLAMGLLMIGIIAFVYYVAGALVEPVNIEPRGLL